jgi:hypothetical protein
MRAKKAKALRRLARSQSVGFPVAAYRSVTHTRNVIHGQKEYQVNMQTQSLAPKCQRALYQRLKESLRRTA